MRRSTRRLLLLVAALPVTLVVLASIYRLGMHQLEGEERTFLASLEWAAETMTTTGYGQDSHWKHPVMQVFVVVVQFSGVFMTFLVFPVFLIPFFEERFEGRIPNQIPSRLRDFILVYRWGPAVSELIHELDQEEIPVVIVEEDLETARRLQDRGRQVVHAEVAEGDHVLDLTHARGLVANGPDHDNAIVTITARQRGFEGPIVALVDQPNLRGPMMRAGASAVFTPRHALAAAVAAKASVKISPRVSGAQSLGSLLEIGEVRVGRGSALAGKTLAKADVRKKTGATIIGRWRDGQLDAQPAIDEPLDVGTILVAAGSEAAIRRLGELATPVAQSGHFVLLGYGETGSKVAQFLRDAGEEVRAVHTEERDGVDRVSDLLDPEMLRDIGAPTAQAVLLTMDSDSETVFAAAVVRDLAADVTIIASVDRSDNVARIHRAGADSAVAIGQVAGHMLAFQLLGEDSISLQPQIKVVRTAAGSLAGKKLLASRVRERTGCSVVAVERRETVIVEFDRNFELEPEDCVFVSGTPHTIQVYFDTIEGSRPS